MKREMPWYKDVKGRSDRQMARPYSLFPEPGCGGAPLTASPTTSPSFRRVWLV